MSHRVKRAERDMGLMWHVSSVMKGPGWLTPRVHVGEGGADDQLRWGLILEGFEIFPGKFELDFIINREL